MSNIALLDTLESHRPDFIGAGSYLAFGSFGVLLPMFITMEVLYWAVFEGLIKLTDQESLILLNAECTDAEKSMLQDAFSESKSLTKRRVRLLAKDLRQQMDNQQRREFAPILAKA